MTKLESAQQTKALLLRQMTDPDAHKTWTVETWASMARILAQAEKAIEIETALQTVEQ